MASYSFSRKADADLDRIYDYGVQAFGVTQADIYFGTLFDRFDLIAQEPFIYPIAYDYNPQYRKSVCGTDTVFYRVQADNSVLIIRILGRQDMEKHLN